MPTTITTPNMNLTVPVVGTQIGPDYAQNINADLSTIDSHNHSSGQGVQITPSGLNINSDLTFLGNNAIALRSSRYSAQGSPLTGSSPDLNCVYVSGVDLYYNDGNGNQIRITQTGSVTGSSGTITGLPSGTASASFAAGAFTFQSATNTPATMNVGPLVVGNSTANSPTVTIAPNAGIASNYSFTLPATLPAALNYMTLDSSGNVSFNSSGATGSGAVVLATAPTFPTTISVSGLISSSIGLFLGATASPTGLTSGGYRYAGNKKGSLIVSDSQTADVSAYVAGGTYLANAGFLYSQTNYGAAYLRVGGDASFANPGFSFITGSSVTASADSAVTPVTVGTISLDGLWTMGVTNGTKAHVMNGYLTVQTPSGSDAFIGLSNGTATWFLDLAASGTDLLFRKSATNWGSVSAAGLWTLGASGGTQTHQVNGNLNITGTIIAANSEGTWSPTYSAATGVDTLATVGARYVRTGNTVICYLFTSYNVPTAGHLSLNFRFTLPIAPNNNFTGDGVQGGGVASWFATTADGNSGAIETINGTKLMITNSIITTTVNNQPGLIRMMFQYTVDT